MTTKAQVLKAIRAYCIGCRGGSVKDVAYCTITDCELYEFRMGKDPRPARVGPTVMPWLQKNKGEEETIDAIKEKDMVRKGEYISVKEV